VVSVLSVDGLSLHFGGLKAVDGVSFKVSSGQVFTICGPNGAGKTTIFNLISRIYDVTTGSIHLDGEDITRLPAAQVARRGVARTFQNIELFGGATVMTNLLLGKEVHRTTPLWTELLFTRRARRQEVEFRECVEEIVEFLGLAAYRDTEVGDLSYGVRKVVELGRALAMKPRLLLLDEPSSGLNDHETALMARWIERIRADRGVTVVMVEHDMSLVESVSDRVLVLAAGTVLAEGTPREIQNDADVIRAYLGD
jgi:branched-chain amino acid transport system ATP-binding protein